MTHVQLADLDWQMIFEDKQRNPTLQFYHDFLPVGAYDNKHVNSDMQTHKIPLLELAGELSKAQ